MRIIVIIVWISLISGCNTNKKLDIEVEEGIVLTDQWVRPGAKDRNTAAFLKIQNNSSEYDTLVSAGSGVAKVVEIHETYSRENDMKGMRHIEYIAIPAGSTVELKPGGYHIMLIGLENDLISDNEINLTLQFKNNGNFDIKAKVR